MAKIIGGLATSHAPQLLMPAEKWGDLPTRTKGPFHPKPDIETELTEAARIAKFRRCEAAISVLRQQLAAWAPDAVIVIGDDQHENILDDNMPPFVVYTAEQTNATRRFPYLGQSQSDQVSSYPVDAALAGELLEGLMEAGFDPAWSKATRDEAGLGHAFGRALKFLMPDRPIPVVPIMVNTYYPPAPTARRCLQFGKAIRQAIDAVARPARIVVVASGGLSHTVIDEALDDAFLTALRRRDEDYMASMPATILVEGTSEIRNWIIAAGAMSGGARMVDYVPCYRTSKGVGCAMGFAIWDQ